jgi:hypothetical protein
VRELAHHRPTVCNRHRSTLHQSRITVGLHPNARYASNQWRRRWHTRPVKRVLYLACSLLITGLITSTYDGDAGANSGGSVASLSGKRIPGTSAANWKPFKACRDGRCVSTLGSYPGQEVLVFSFPDSRSATAFYSDPSKLNDDELAISRVSFLSKGGPVPQPSRWLQVRSCVARAANEDPQAPPVGAPAAVPSQSDTCPKGLVSTSIEIASITQRGDVVVFVQSDGYFFALDGKGLTKAQLHSYPAKNSAITRATLSLVRIHRAS